MRRPNRTSPKLRRSRKFGQVAKLNRGLEDGIWARLAASDTVLRSRRARLEAIKGEQTPAEIGAKHGIHLTMLAAWKWAAVLGTAATFSPKAADSTAVSEADPAKLHAKIGKLVAERDFLAKAFGR